MVVIVKEKKICRILEFLLLGKRKYIFIFRGFSSFKFRKKGIFFLYLGI